MKSKFVAPLSLAGSVAALFLFQVDFVSAIREHSSNGSEANGVISRFNNLREGDKQDLLNFLRSL